MNRRLNVALLAAIFICQPKAHAETYDYLKVAAGAVIVGAAVWYVTQPESAAPVERAQIPSAPADLPTANIEHTDEIKVSANNAKQVTSETKRVKHGKKEYDDQDEQDFMHFVFTMNWN